MFQTQTKQNKTLISVAAAQKFLQDAKISWEPYSILLFQPFLLCFWRPACPFLPNPFPLSSFSLALKVSRALPTIMFKVDAERWRKSWKPWTNRATQAAQRKPLFTSIHAIQGIACVESGVSWCATGSSPICSKGFVKTREVRPFTYLLMRYARYSHDDFSNCSVCCLQTDMLSS